MHVIKDKADRFLKVTSQSFQEKNLQKFLDMGYIEAFQLLLDDIAKKSKTPYAEGERMTKSDLSRIRDTVVMFYNVMRENMIKGSSKDLERIQNDPFSALVAANDYLYAMTMKTLGSPDIPESFGKGMQGLIKEVACSVESEIKKSDREDTLVDRCYEKQRWKDAVDVISETEKTKEQILSKEAVPFGVARYAGEYFALKKRQEGHGKWWIFFHKKENEARTKLLEEMKETLKTVLGEGKEPDELNPVDIAGIYHKQNFDERVNKTFQKGIALRHKLPSDYVKHEPTSTERADKEKSEPDKDEIAFEEEMRMPLEFEEDAFKESEPITVTYVTKVEDKIVTGTVHHDSGDKEVDLSKFEGDKSPLAR